jgi:hypothetical protein
MTEVDWQLVDASVDESVQSVTTAIMVVYIVVPIVSLLIVIGGIVLCVLFCGCGNKPRHTCPCGPCAGSAAEDEEVEKGLVPPESANGGGQINAIRVDNFFQNAWKENVWL